jgi:hypothetical protein
MRGVVAILAIVTTSCSVVLMETTEKNWKPFKGEPRCTGTSGYGAWDGLLAASFVMTAITADRTVGEEGASTVQGIGAAGAVVHAIGAIIGVTRAGRCKEQRDARDRYLLTQPTAAPPSIAAPYTPAPSSPPVDAGVDAVLVDAMPVDAAPITPDARPFFVDPEEPPRPRR